METHEVETKAFNGWVMAFVLFVAGVAVGFAGYYLIKEVREGAMSVWFVPGWGIVTTIWLVLVCGFFTLEPNMSAVLILFGKYTGTVRTSGFYWANPLLIKKKVYWDV